MARQRPQWTRLRRLMAKAALTSVSTAMMMKAMGRSLGIAISAGRELVRVQRAAERDIRAADDGRAEQPARGDGSGKLPCAAVMPERGHEQIDERQWHEKFPGELHQLIHAQ